MKIRGNGSGSVHGPNWWLERKPGPGHSLPHPGKRDEEISFRRLGIAFRRDRWLVLGAVLLALVMAALVTRCQTRIYTAQATIQIREEQPALGRLSDRLPINLGPLGSLGGGGIATDLGILKSRAVAEAVVDSVGLTVQLLDPDTVAEPFLRVLEGGEGFRPAEYLLELQEDGEYTLEVEKGVAPSPLPRRLRVGRPFRLGPSTLMLAPAVRANPPKRIRFATVPFRHAVASLREDLKVLRPDPGAQIVAVEYRSPVRYQAAEVPNAVAQSFIRYRGETEDAESGNTIAFLSDQVARYQGQLAEAEQKLERFREQEQVIAPLEQASGQVRQFIELQSRRNELQTEREALGNILARIDATPASDTAASPYLQLASFPAFLSNGAVQSILQTLTEFQSERSKLLVRRTPQNDEVQQLSQRIEELQLQLYQLARNYLRSTGSEVASLDNALIRFQGELETVPSREVEYNRLLREQQLLEQVYTLLQTRLKEEQVTAAAAPAEVRVLDAALVPEGPSSPRPLLNFALAGVLGLVTAVGLVFVREIRDPKVRTPDDVADATGGMPILGVIPRSSFPDGSRNDRRRLPASTGSRPTGGLITLDTDSPASEAYRSVRNRIAFADPERAPRLLVVTSATGEDGKNATAANLAVSLAQQGLQTLLIDADLRLGELHQLLDVPGAPGFTEVVLGQATIGDAVRSIPVGEQGVPLHFLPAGTLPGAPGELVGLPVVQRVLQKLREDYQAVVLSAPPLASSTDAALLGRIADATVLVTRLGATEREALEYAAAQLHEFGIPVGGIVLNDLRNSGHEQGWFRTNRTG